MVWSLSLSLATAACIGHLPPCPAAGGPAWTELESAHFRLRTDQAPADARGTLAELEQLRTALLHVFGASDDLDTGRVPAIAVDRGWTDFASRNAEGYFAHALFQPLVVISAGGPLFRLRVIKHELVHYLSGQIIPRQPLWFAEGLASFYETIEYDTGSGRITVGGPPPALLEAAQQTGVANIQEIFGATSIDATDDRYAATRFYAAAWITVHYLMSRRPEAMMRYEKALRDGASPEAAWTAAFGAETPAALADEVRHYLDGGSYNMLVYRLEAPKLAAPVERRMTDADTHATRALLYLTGRRTHALRAELSIAVEAPKAAAQREVAEALRQQPDHVMAVAIAAVMLDAHVDVGIARAATEKNTGDWLAWLMLAAALDDRGDTAGAREAMARARDASRGDRSIDLPRLAIEAD